MNKMGAFSKNSCWSTFIGQQLLLTSFLFIHIDRCTVGESDAIGFIQGFQVNLVETDARLDGHDSTEYFAVLARIE